MKLWKRARVLCCLVAVAVCLVGCAVDTGPPGRHESLGPPQVNSGTTTPAAESSSWIDFSIRRLDELQRLSEPIADCIQRFDTSHRSFHGCIDWHSAVHATYALLAISRITGNEAYRDIAMKAVGGPEALAAEAAALREGRLDEEQPYGFAWALLLDVEANRSGITAFHEVATAARNQILDLARLDDEALYRTVADSDYDNLTWPTYALARWSAHFSDDRATDAAKSIAQRIISPQGIAAACANQSTNFGFLPPCHLVPLLAAEVGLSSEYPVPLPDLRDTNVVYAQPGQSAHPAGLNFSRSWGLYAAWRMSHDPALLEGWTRLVTAHLAMEDRWRTGYRQYAHWVAQFGVFSIAATFD